MNRKYSLYSSIALAVAALSAGGAVAGDTDHFVGRAGSTLGTPEQIERERLAVRIFESAPVQREMHKLETFYAADPTAAMPDATLTLKRAAAATAMGEALAVVNQDTGRPLAFWAVTAPHAWGGVKVPLSGLMIDDPDNIYRGIAIDGAASYEISGKVIGTAPAQETFILHNVISGTSKTQKVRTQEDENGYVALDRLPLKADGSFTITIDASPVAGRPDHIQSDPEEHDAYLLIRDTLSDWSRQNPVQLSVRRLSGPPVSPPLSEAQMVEKAAQLVSTTGPYWTAWAHKVFFSRPVNSYTHIVNRVSGWGFIKCGYYSLKDDEALVFHLDRKQAAYLGFQLSDVWGQGQAYNYMAQTGSLTNAQARSNADGTYSYAISVADPGVYNWLNPGGLHAGTFCTRWQNLPAGVTTDDAVRSVEVVKLSDLRRSFPADAAWVTPAGRAAQLKARVESYTRRLTTGA